MTCEFSLEHYEEILEKAKKAGYTFRTLSETKGDMDGSVILIRHDIDISPAYALPFAKIEHRLGVKASYFVLLHEPTYNPFDASNLEIFRELLRLGHEIGLHYDTQFFEKRGGDPIQGVLQDVQALEKALGIRITSISQHNPASSKVHQELGKKLSKVVVDTYDPRLVRGEFLYLSDSGRKWRNGCVCTEIGKHQKIQVLTHPIWWQHPESGFAEILRKHTRHASRDVQQYIETLIETTARYLKEREKLDLQREASYQKYYQNR